MNLNQNATTLETLKRDLAELDVVWQSIRSLPSAVLVPDTMPGSYLDDAFECDIVGTVVIAKGSK